jgi:hypothetical protein
LFIAYVNVEGKYNDHIKSITDVHRFDRRVPALTLSTFLWATSNRAYKVVEACPPI